MKPYLRNKKIKGHGPGKRDVAKHGWRNWWEDFNNFISRKTAKQNLPIEINNELACKDCGEWNCWCHMD